VVRQPGRGFVGQDTVRRGENHTFGALVQQLLDGLGDGAAGVDHVVDHHAEPAVDITDAVVAATHGVLSDPATTRLSTCGAREIILTNTLPIPDEKRFPGMTVLSIAPLLARAIHEVFDDGSVTSLFDGNA